MDKNAIKKYAVWARRELISRVSQKALQYGITEENIIPADAATVNGVVLSNEEKKQRRALIEKINDKGYQQVMEEVAYTWFNRFIALRFMEVNGYLPSHVRVFTDDENNFKPQILTEAINLDFDGLNMDKVFELKAANDSDALFKYLVIIQCNALNPILPRMFQRISDYTELLFPDNLLREGSAVHRLITDIDINNFDVKSDYGQIEIIGWLYQYYNDEKKEQVINFNKGAIKKEDVPAATQLFTTDWVVRYIIDNSLGRYWIERNPESALKDELQYLVPDFDKIGSKFNNITPKELSVFDPCMGSAHFLLYAFEILMKIYVEYGYTEREAATEIITHNIYGLDIDERASQLAYFAVMMKARQYDRRFLTRKDENGNPDVPQPHLYEICESNGVDSFTLDYFGNGNEEIICAIKSIINQMQDAKEYGSILTITPVNFELLYTRFEEVEKDVHISREMVLSSLLPLVQVAELLSRKYSVVVTNPPYLNKYNAKLKKFINDNYKDYAGDLFSVFMHRNFGFCERNGYSGFMTPFVWMFIKTYENLRHNLINNKTITTLVQMEYSAFEEATVPICSFVLKNELSNEKGCYFRLSDFRGGMDVQKQKVLEAISNPACGYYYNVNQNNFLKIPSYPIAYWVGDAIYGAFENGEELRKYAPPRQGIATSDNNRFLRLWYEVVLQNIGFNFTSLDEAKDSHYKWFPYNKGGDYRKWYGNQEYVVNWENDGYEIRNFFENGKIRSRPQNTQYFFRESITWSDISSTYFGVRYSPNGFAFDMSGSSCFPEHDMILYITGYMCSKLSTVFTRIMNPSIHTQVGNIATLPLFIDESKHEAVDKLVSDCIATSKAEWDSFEISWNFRRHPLVPTANDWIEQKSSQFAQSRLEKFALLSWHYEQWEILCKHRFETLKHNEEEINRIFIDIYKVQGEITPEVDDGDITVCLADKKREIKSLISYAVGCMFGRYSLDVEGLAYAGGEWDDSKYVTFKADKDSIIPISDDEYFEDDIVNRFVHFIEIVYGKKSLEDNLKFIAESLGGSGQPREVIRKYFMNDFYTDHLKTYQKRPIYWLFDSGKKNGFKALVYMHRYQPDTIARMRTDYVHEQQSRYRTAIADLEQRIASAATSERVKLNKKLKTLKDQSAEIQVYEEKIHHLADQYISIDLDDGVKVNYAKFQDVLAKIK